MKINDNFSNKNDFNYLNKFDFSKNDSFGLPLQNLNSKNTKENNDNINHSNIDPRLELTLTYLDINSTMPTFITNNISFNDILLLSKKDLIDLGFSLVERNRILHFSQEFKRYGKKYNIQEIENFFNEFQNLNMLTNNNIQSIPPKQESENELKINNLSKRNNYNNFDNNYNYSFNNDNSNNNNCISQNNQNINNNLFNADNKSYNLNDEQNQLKDNISFPYGNKNNKSNYNASNNNDIKIKNNYKDSNKIKNKNYKQNKNYQDFDNKSACNNNYNEMNSSYLIRQNSKASKNSSYSKNSKSRLVTISKTIVPSASSSESIVQKYQNLSEEIDNYFKKYNDYKEQKKNKMKRYQIITSSSNNSKKNYNYNPLYANSSKISAKNNAKKKKNSQNNNIKSMNNFNNVYDMNNLNDFNMNKFDQKVSSEFLSQKLQELQNKKKELKMKLNTVCDNENKKKMIIRYLEEEENK